MQLWVLITHNFYTNAFPLLPHFLGLSSTLPGHHNRSQSLNLDLIAKQDFHVVRVLKSYAQRQKMVGVVLQREQEWKPRVISSSPGSALSHE